MNDDLSSKYGSFYAEGLRLRSDAGESCLSRLNEDKIPVELLPLVSYAEFWGIADDTFRIELVQAAPAHIWHDFRDSVSRHEDALMAWLAGPEAMHRPPSPEYLAFSFMIQAFDWPRE